MSAYRVFVSDYFISGLIFSSLVLAALLLGRRLLAAAGGAPGELPGHPTRGGLGAAQCALIAFAVVFLSRFLIVDHILDPSSLFQDESLDSCVDPLRQKLGLPTWGFRLHAHYSISRIVLDTIGFDPTALRLFHAFRFALALGLFVFFLHGVFGAWIVLLVGAILAASYPYIWHSLWTGSIGSGALPSLLVFGMLLREKKISKAAAIATGSVAAPSLYVYPGATVAIACFLVFHFLFFRERWSLVTLSVLAASAFIAKGVADWIYAMPLFGTAYAGGSFSLQHLTEALRVVPLDFLYRSTSFNSHNFHGPYFEPVLLWALALGVLVPSRFFRFSLCVFALNVVLVGFTGPYPGARRAMWSLPLLYLGCVQSAFLVAERTPRLAPLVKMAFVASLLLVCARDVVIGRNHFPVYAPDPFYRSAVAFLGKHAPLEAEIVIFENPNNEFRSHPYWCALGYTPSLWPPSRVPTIVPKNAPHPTRQKKDYWVLMQPTDTLADVERVFGPHEEEFLYPSDLPQALRDVAPNPSPMRVVRVRPR